MCSELIEESRRSSERAMEALQQIRGGAETSARQIAEIASATVEQGAATADIVQRIEHIAAMAGENDSSVQAASAAADSLAALVSQLEAEIDRFRAR